MAARVCLEWRTRALRTGVPLRGRQCAQPCRLLSSAAMPRHSTEVSKAPPRDPILHQQQNQQKSVNQNPAAGHASHYASHPNSHSDGQVYGGHGSCSSTPYSSTDNPVAMTSWRDTEQATHCAVSGGSHTLLHLPSSAVECFGVYRVHGPALLHKHGARLVARLLPGGRLELLSETPAPEVEDAFTHPTTFTHDSLASMEEMPYHASVLHPVQHSALQTWQDGMPASSRAQRGLDFGSGREKEAGRAVNREGSKPCVSASSMDADAEGIADGHFDTWCVQALASSCDPCDIATLTGTPHLLPQGIAKVYSSWSVPGHLHHNSADSSQSLHGGQGSNAPDAGLQSCAGAPMRGHTQVAASHSASLPELSDVWSGVVPGAHMRVQSQQSEQQEHVQHVQQYLAEHYVAYGSHAQVHRRDSSTWSSRSPAARLPLNAAVRATDTSPNAGDAAARNEEDNATNGQAAVTPPLPECILVGTHVELGLLPASRLLTPSADGCLPLPGLRAHHGRAYLAVQCVPEDIAILIGPAEHVSHPINVSP